MKKGTVYFIISLVILLLGGGGLYYLLEWEKSSEAELNSRLQLVPLILLEKAEKRYQYFEFSGELNGIDLAKNILSVKVASTTLSLTETSTISYEKDNIYNFGLDEKTKIYRVNYNDLFAEGSEKEINASELKEGDELVIIINKKETAKKDNFMAREIILKISGENF